MPILDRLAVNLKALAELGPAPLMLYGRYQLGLRSGYLRRKTLPPDPFPTAKLHPLTFLSIPTRDELLAFQQDDTALLESAGDIAGGRDRLFGSTPRPLSLTVSGPPAHWTAYARGQAHTGEDDIKLVWEGGRFGWALTLARAYCLTNDERHAEAFWNLTERFLEGNPPYHGPHWESAQEAAMRMISLLVAFQAFEDARATTNARKESLALAVAAHAGRIPPTLVYARAQNNNHLLSEAVGLLTAGAVLPDHPDAPDWKAQGWRWFNRGLQAQIAGDGSYIQQSANYHRLMLQISLWGTAAARSQGLEAESETQSRLAAATRWALGLVDSQTGRLPNLGPNDGGRLLPLSSTQFSDYRPTLAAAARAFLKEDPFPPGPWDELSFWLGLETGLPQEESPIRASRAIPQVVLHNEVSDSWAYLRVQEFSGRPGHADLLHFDLWLDGMNVAQDAGTYLYNASPPWNNALARTATHNTITVGGRDQMTRAGRFLWLDWPACTLTERIERGDGTVHSAAGQHDGYRRQGVIHARRAAALTDGGWEVEDRLTASPGHQSGAAIQARLHWLLPDWSFIIQEEGPVFRLALESPGGAVELSVEAPEAQSRLQLVRAGELLSGPGPADPTQGWVSPTYASKEPALSVALLVEGRLPIKLRSLWAF